MHLIVRWIINALGLLGIAYLVPGIEVATFYTALWVALLLGLANALVRPVLIILTLPLTIITLGLFVFVINAALIWIVAHWVDGFSIIGFVDALIAAILLSAVSWVGSRFVHTLKE